MRMTFSSTGLFAVNLDGDWSNSVIFIDYRLMILSLDII